MLRVGKFLECLECGLQCVGLVERITGRNLTLPVADSMGVRIDVRFDAFSHSVNLLFDCRRFHVNCEVVRSMAVLADGLCSLTCNRSCRTRRLGLPRGRTPEGPGTLA